MFLRRRFGRWFVILGSLALFCTPFLLIYLANAGLQSKLKRGEEFVIPVAIDKSSYENNTNAHLLTVTEEQDESQSVSRSQNMGSNYEDVVDIITLNELDSDLTHSRVLIVGAASFLGFHLSVLLNNQGVTTKLVEDSKIIHTFDSTIFERIRKLESSPPELIDFSDKSRFPDLIRNFNPSVIVYVPTTLFSYEEATTTNKYFSVVDFSRELEVFFSILKHIQDSDHLTKPRVILLSISNRDVLTLAKVWFSTHERLLSYFLKSNQIQSSIFRVQKIQKELRQDTGELHPTLNYVVNVLEKVMKSSKNVFVDLGCSDCVPLQGFSKLSLTTYHDNETESHLPIHYTKGLSHSRNVVMTTYFTNVKNPMHSVGYAANKFRFMRSWFLSCKRLGLDMVVFHDQLSNDFQKRVKHYYSHIDFIKTSSAGGSPNDKRFKIFFDYISSHQEVQNIVLTDIRDASLGHNPFEIMTQIGDYIFVGQDLPFFFSTSSYGFVLNKVTRCYGNEAQGEAVKLYTLFNAGVLGGSRSAMLNTLQLINKYLDKAPSHLNCNMPALAVVLHKHLYDQTFSGYPFNNLFGVLYGGSQGVAVMHKTGHRIYP